MKDKIVIDKKKAFIGALAIGGIFLAILIGSFAIDYFKGGYREVLGQYEEERELLYDFNGDKASEKSTNDNGKTSSKENTTKETETVKKEDIPKESSGGNNEIKVDIKGCIEKPGLYTLRGGDRIEDLIKLSGGFTKEADTSKVHLSKKLVDEDVIYVSKIGENIEENNIEYLKESSERDRVVLEGSSKSKVNINKATIEELKTLNGIGDTKAQSIIDHRNKEGMFKNVEDLINVEGIGEKTLNKFIDSVDIK